MIAEDTPQNKLCVDLIGPYHILVKRKNNLILKAVTLIDPVTGWFEITQYSNKKAMPIANLVETTWPVWYPWLVEIMYDQCGELFGNEFKN